MAVPSSPTHICNLALDLLGQASVSSIDSPSSANEQVLSRWYDITRRIVLREYVWNFAKKRAILTRNTDAPLFDYPDAYDLPRGCVRILDIGGEGEKYRIDDYDIEGRTLMVDAAGSTSLRLRYIQDITDVTLMDPLFINVFILRLALKVAYKFTLKPGVVANINQLLKEDEPKAASVDGQEKPPTRIERSRALAARRRVSPNIASKYTVFN